MPKTVKLNSPAIAAQIEAALREPVDKPWKQQRLPAMRMVAQGQWTLQQIGDAVGAGRSSVAVWLKTLREKGFAALLAWQPGQGAPPQVDAATQAEITRGLEQGRWRRGRDLQRWLQEKHAIELSLHGIYYYLGKAGGVLKVPLEDPR